MNKYTSTLIALLWSCAAHAAAQADHPLVGRYEGSEMVGYFNKDYDEADVIESPIFNTDHSADNGWRKLEGHVQLYYYELPSGRSSLEVLRTADYNLDLSRRRAAAVVAALSGEYGIDAARLKPRGAGATQPLASNDNEDGRAKNRRVELVRE